MTPAQEAVDVQVASEADIRAAVARALSEAHVTIPELRRQAEQGRFSSEECRLTWFAVSPFVDRIA